MNPLFDTPHPWGTKSPLVFSIGLWSLRAYVDGVVDRDLRDVGGVVGRPTQAVHDRRQGEELLPLPRGDMMRESIDQLLVPREVVDGLIRGVDVRGQEGGEGLVQDGHGRFPGGVHFLDQPWFEPALRERGIRPGDALCVVPDPLEQLGDEPRIVQLDLRCGVRGGAPAVWATLYCFATIQ